MRKIKKYFIIILLSIFTLTTVETSSLNFSAYIVQAKVSSSTKRKAQEAYRKFLTQRRYRYFTLSMDNQSLAHSRYNCTYHIRSDAFIVSRSNTGNYKSLVDINATADFVHDF